MRNGAIRIEYVAGEIKGAYVNAGLDAVYGRMFKAARRNAKRWPDKVEHGIQVIVFGTFLLEAVCNDLYRGFLFGQVPENGLADAVWKATMRLAIREKLNVATEISSLSKDEIHKQMRKLQLLFDLRNRLAHFRDAYTVWGGARGFRYEGGKLAQGPRA